MTKYVIGPDVAVRLAHERTVIGAGHQILAPTLRDDQEGGSARPTRWSPSTSL